MASRRKERRDPEATRQALLRAGARLFAESGYDGVRVDALARRAGVNKAMINYHFGGKRQLYETIMSSAFRELADRVAELRASSRPADELLSRFVEGFAEIATDRLPNFPALVVRGILGAGRISPKLLPVMAEILGGMHEIIERGARDGSLRRVDPNAAYMNLIGGLAFFFATEPARRHAFETQGLGEPPSADTYVRYVQELLRRGLAPTPRPRARRGAAS
jgi:TetR/AcrR family transcriptional regulator